MGYQSDEDIRAAVAKRRAAQLAAAASIPDNTPPDAQDPAGDAQAASKAAWDAGIDYQGNPHRGKADMEALRVLLIKRGISWPYTLDYSPEQATKILIPKRLAGVNYETYAYLLLTGEEMTEDERDIHTHDGSSTVLTLKEHDAYLKNLWYSRGTFAQAWKWNLAQDAKKAGTPGAGASGNTLDDEG